MHVAAIIAAGGRGVRIGGDRPKQFLDLGDGTSALERSLAAIAGCALVNEIVIALPSAAGEAEWLPPRHSTPIVCVTGGARRQDSVANALARVSDAVDLIVIHDAARPFVTAALVERTIRAADEHGAAIAALPVSDTVKQAGPAGADGSHLIRSTLPRETIFLAQTPQAFRRDVLAHAMTAGIDAIVTDEAMLVERLGFAVHIVEGDPRNIKVTTPDDLQSARSLATAASGAMDAREKPAPLTALRIGTGYDLHRLVPGRPLILGGVHIPFAFGLDGHSDADLVCHAVTDAILGGACAGDIGRLFPDSDPAWKDADSVLLLRRAGDHLRQSGFVVVNVDVTVIAEEPKLLPHLGAMRANLANALGIEASAISIKGKTNEKVDAIGRGEAMACHAVALLCKT